MFKKALLLAAVIVGATALGVSAQAPTPTPTPTPTITVTITCAGVTLAGETGGPVDGLAMAQAFVDETLGLDAQRVVNGTFENVLVPWTSSPLTGTHSVRADVWLFVPYIGNAEIHTEPALLICSESLHIREYLASPASDAKVVGGGVEITLHFNDLVNPANGGLVEVWETYDGSTNLTARFVREAGTSWAMEVDGADGSSIFTAKLMGAKGAWQWSVEKPTAVKISIFRAETLKIKWPPKGWVWTCVQIAKGRTLVCAWIPPGVARRLPCANCR